MPLCLFYGDRDALIPEANFQLLQDQVLPKGESIGPLHQKSGNVEIHKISDYNHLDYMWAKDASDLVNTPLRTFLTNVMTTPLQ